VSPVRRASSVPGLRSAIEGAPQPEPEQIKRPPRPVKPVRFTLDLAPDLHMVLKRFALDAEVDASVVMRAMIVMLRDDPDLAAQVRDRVWQQ
jgi:hypothetical protein